MFMRQETTEEIFKISSRLNILNVSDLDSIVEKRIKSRILNYIHDDGHFINDFLPKLQ